jgi:hypothetical protein
MLIFLLAFLHNELDLVCQYNENLRMLYFSKVEMERKPLVVKIWDKSRRIAKSESGKPPHTEELRRLNFPVVQLGMNCYIFPIALQGYEDVLNLENSYLNASPKGKISSIQW